MGNNSLLEKLMPIIDDITITEIKIQQLRRKNYEVPKELIDQKANQQEYLTEFLLQNNAIKFNLDF